MKNNNKIYIECSGFDHVLRIEKDDEDHQILFYLAMFEYSYSKASLWRRFRFWWRWFITGEIYNDQMVLGKDEAKELLKFLKQHLECDVKNGSI